MRFGRLALALVAIALAAWIIKNHDRALRSLRPAADRPESSAAASRDPALSEAAREAEKPSGGAVSENMTPDQVRAILGSPDSIESGTSDTGKPRERWIYRQAGKAVVFENGIAISVEAP